MISLKVVSLIISYAFIARAQLSYDPDSKNFSCVVPNGSFCAGDSMNTSVIVHCKDGVGVAADCCAELQDQTAQCYQSSTSAGDGACASNGTAYPVSGSKFPIPPNKNTTPGSPAVISKGDDECKCNNSTHPPLPPYPSSSSVPPVKSSPAPPPQYSTPPPPSTTPKGAVLSSMPSSSSTSPCSSGFPMKPSSSITPSKSYSSSRLPSNWSPTPTPTPTTTTPSSSVKAPIFVGAAMAHTVGAEMFAVAGFAALLLRI